MFNEPMFAIVTPFSTDGKEIDFVALKKYLQFLEERGVKVILTNGTTGEFSSLTIAERKSLVEFCRGNFSGKIVNHIGTSSIKDTLDLADHAKDFCDAIMSLPPYYYANATDEGVYQYFRTILLSTDQPFYIYNFPKHTQITVTNQIITALKKEFLHLVGIKDSSGDFALSKGYYETGIDVYVGSDTKALETLDYGMKGNVTGGGNVVPEFLVNIVSSYQKNDRERVNQFFEVYTIWNSFRKSLPIHEVAIVKAGLSTRIEDFPPYVRTPLLACTEEEMKQIKTKLNEEILPKLHDLLKRGA